MGLDLALEESVFTLTRHREKTRTRTTSMNRLEGDSGSHGSTFPGYKDREGSMGDG